MISHLHGDHFFGLIGLLNSMHLLGRKDEIHLYAPASLQDIIQLQLEVSQTILRYPMIFHPLIMDSYQLIYDQERLSVHSFPLRHSIPACGFVFREKNPPRKVKEARSYAYCSDTAYNENMIPYIGGVGLLYHEATFMQNLASAAAEKFHSTAMEAATIADKAQVKKLLIGHFSARYDDTGPLLAEAREIFPETYPAEEGIAIQI
jgi:ribonuclease Z